MSTLVSSQKPPPLPIRSPNNDNLGQRPFIAPAESRSTIRRYARKSVNPQTISVDSVLLLLNDSLYGLSVLQPVIPRLDGLLRQITEITDSLEARKKDIDERLDVKIFKAHAPPPTPAVTIGPNDSPTMQHPFSKPEAGDVTLRLWIYEIQKNAWLFNEKTLQYEYTTTNLLNQNSRRKKLIAMGEQVYGSWVKVMLNLGLVLNQMQGNRQRITERHVDNLVLATGFEDIIDHLEPSEAKRVYMQGEKHLLGYGVEQCFDSAFKRFEIASRLGLSEAHAMIGLMYEFGLGHSKDLPLAVKHYTAAIRGGDADAMNNLARMLETGKGCEISTKTAFELYKRAGARGHLDGQTNYAFMLENGIGCNANPKLALETYKIAAEKGYAKAQNALGSCYYRGIGTEKDYFIACKYFQTAASKGYANAQNNFGICLEAGHGVPKDVIQAKIQYTLATENRHANGACNLAYLLFQQGTLTEAIEKFYLAKALGSVEATFHLGRIYEVGCNDSRGVVLQQDLAMATRFYEEAAAKNHEGAAIRLASILICGPKSLVNLKLALSILGKCASEKEDNQAANTVSNEAHNDVKISNVGGNADAQNMLGELAEMGLYSGIESKADYATAAYWYRKAIQQGHHRAMFNMGAMYERGLHVEHDIEQAIRFYNESAKQGNQDAIQRIIDLKKVGVGSK